MKIWTERTGGKKGNNRWKKVWKTTDTCEKKIKGTFLKVGYEKNNQTVKDCKSIKHIIVQNQIESVFAVNIVEKSFQQRKADKTKEMRLKNVPLGRRHYSCASENLHALKLYMTHTIKIRTLFTQT